MRTVQRLASLMRRCARHEGLPTMGTGAAALACGLAHSRACQVTDAGLSGPSTYLGCTTSSLDLPSMGIGCAEPALSRSFATVSLQQPASLTMHARFYRSPRRCDTRLQFRCSDMVLPICRLLHFMQKMAKVGMKAPTPIHAVPAMHPLMHQTLHRAAQSWTRALPSQTLMQRQKHSHGRCDIPASSDHLLHLLARTGCSAVSWERRIMRPQEASSGGEPMLLLGGGKDGIHTGSQALAAFAASTLVMVCALHGAGFTRWRV